MDITMETLYRRKWKANNRGYNAEYRRKNKLYYRIYRKLHRKTLRAQCRERYISEKLRAFQIVSGMKLPRCGSCGCEDLRILEIDHVNGGGTKELKALSPRMFRRAIIRGERKTDDLQILCKVCNVRKYVERTFGLKFDVGFIGGVA